MFLTPSLLSFPFYRLMNDDYIPSRNAQGPFKSGFMFLLRLAWQSRFRLPALVFLAYMLFDIRIQFEMNIHPQRELIDDDSDDEEDDDDEDDDDDGSDDDDDESEIDDDDEVYELNNHYHQHFVDSHSPYYSAPDDTHSSESADADQVIPLTRKFHHHNLSSSQL